MASAEVRPQLWPVHSRLGSARRPRYYLRPTGALARHNYSSARTRAAKLLQLGLVARPCLSAAGLRRRRLPMAPGRICCIRESHAGSERLLLLHAGLPPQAAARRSLASADAVLGRRSQSRGAENSASSSPEAQSRASRPGPPAPSTQHQRQQCPVNSDTRPVCRRETYCTPPSPTLNIARLQRCVSKRRPPPACLRAKNCACS